MTSSSAPPGLVTNREGFKMSASIQELPGLLRDKPSQNQRQYTDHRASKKCRS